MLYVEVEGEDDIRLIRKNLAEARIFSRRPIETDPDILVIRTFRQLRDVVYFGDELVLKANKGNIFRAILLNTLLWTSKENKTYWRLLGGDDIYRLVLRHDDIEIAYLDSLDFDYVLKYFLGASELGVKLMLNEIKHQYNLECAIDLIGKLKCIRHSLRQNRMYNATKIWLYILNARILKGVYANKVGRALYINQEEALYALAKKTGRFDIEHLFYSTSTPDGVTGISMSNDDLNIITINFTDESALYEFVERTGLALDRGCGTVSEIDDV